MRPLSRIGELLLVVAQADGQMYFEPGPPICRQAASADFDWRAWPLDAGQIDLLAGHGVAADVRAALLSFTATLTRLLHERGEHRRSACITDCIEDEGWDALVEAAHHALSLLYPPSLSPESAMSPPPQEHP